MSRPIREGDEVRTTKDVRLYKLNQIVPAGSTGVVTGTVHAASNLIIVLLAESGWAVVFEASTLETIPKETV